MDGGNSIMNSCPRCNTEVTLETIRYYDRCNPGWGIYKYIIKCPKCGYELRRNGKKHRQELIKAWDAIKLEKWGTCDTCGKTIFYKDRYIHTDSGDHFCCDQCYQEREKYYHADAEYEIAR